MNKTATQKKDKKNVFLIVTVVCGTGRFRLHATNFKIMFFVVGPVLLYLPFVFMFLYISLNYFVKGKKSVCIVVLGDLGRSPRMLYHTSSFAKEGFHVDLVGYGGEFSR